MLRLPEYEPILIRPSWNRVILRETNQTEILLNVCIIIIIIIVIRSMNLPSQFQTLIRNLMCVVH